ncbi:hypothetical protein HZB74_00065 [Candidatus Saccharibacteria bacterium]|nr:hypothetical protein [Candidatus Saccharibacteria bacterium]
MAKRKARERDYESGGVGFVGSILLGAGFGVLFDEVIAGILLGIGAGFLVMAHFTRTQD